MSLRAQERIELVAQRRPQAVALARRLSLATRAEPALVRAARLSAGLDATAEADLWFSPLVAGAGPLGLALDPGVADRLRGGLDPGEREAAWALVETHHRSEPWSIRLEERINYLTAGGGDPAEIEELLAAALDELHDTDERAALGIARWLLAALARLPATARATSAASAAEVVAGARVDGRIGDLDALTPEQRSAWLPKLLGGLGTVDLPVRLQPGAVVLGGDPAGATLVSVPKTEPIVLTVDSERGSETVRLRAGESRRLAIGTGAGAIDPEGGLRGTAVRLRTVTGDEIRVVPVAVGRLTYDGDDLAPAIAIAERTVVTVADDLPPRVLFTPTTAPSAPTGETRREGELTYLDVYEPFTPAPLTTPAVGDRWRLADGYPGGGTVALVQPNEILVAVEGEQLVERGAALVTERPWGAVFGLALGRDRQGFLRVAPLAVPAPASAPPVAFDPHPLLGDVHIPRTVDRELDELLRTFEVVAVTGPEHPGKARTLWEAVRRAQADAEIEWLDHPPDLVRRLEADPLPPGAKVAAVLGDVTLDHPAIAEVRIAPTLTPEEVDEAWRRFGPEFALDPKDPWSADALAARRRAVERARADREPNRLGVALHGLARALRESGSFSAEERRALLDEAAGVTRDAVGLHALAVELLEDGDREQALRLVERSLEATSVPALRRDALITRTEVLGQLELLPEAVTSAAEAVEAARAAGDAPELARTLRLLSRAYTNARDERAVHAAAEALRVARPLGGLDAILALDALADGLERLGRIAGAIEPSQEAFDLAMAQDDRELALDHARRHAERLQRAGRSPEAVPVLGAAVTIARGGDRRRLAELLGEHGRLLAEVRDDVGALAALDESAALWRGLHAEGQADAMPLVAALDASSQAHERMGDRAAAAARVAEQLELVPDSPLRQGLQERLRVLRRERPVGVWSDGAIRLFPDRLETPRGTIELAQIASVHTEHGALLRRADIRIELRDGTRFDLELEEARSLNPRANERRADAFVAAIRSHLGTQQA